MATQALGKNVFGYKVAIFGHDLGAGRLRRRHARRLVPAGDARRVRLLLLADDLRHRDLRRHGQPHRHRARRRRRRAARSAAAAGGQDRSRQGQPRAADRLRHRPRRADAACARRARCPRASRSGDGYPRRAGVRARDRDGRTTGCRPDGHRTSREHVDAELPLAEENRRERAWHDAPVVLDDAGRQQALRRHRRRQRPGHRAPQGHHHRPRRPERRRQDDGLQPAHRRHPARLRLGHPQRRRARRPRPPPASPARAWCARSRTSASSTACRACRT